ncbi:hypothetical protein, partial [Peribacillus cavernae]|uniref:hypothetical protein n=1 Tax=Peribacillus cavernae TaxID=1674310 RepID=UPI001C8DE8EA
NFTVQLSVTYSAARQLREACITLLEHKNPSISPKDAVFKKIPERDLIQAIHTVESLTRPPDQTLAYSELLQYYGTVRKFLPFSPRLADVGESRL